MCYLHMQAAHMEVMRFSHSRARGSKVRFRSRGKIRLPGCMEIGEIFGPRLWNVLSLLISITARKLACARYEDLNLGCDLKSFYD